MGSPDEQMEQQVRSCEMIVMVLYNEAMRPGIEKEYNFARDCRKPVLLFVEDGFERDQGNALQRIWNDRDIMSVAFRDNEHLIEVLERSLYRDMLVAFRSWCYSRGQNVGRFRIEGNEDA